MWRIPEYWKNKSMFGQTGHLEVDTQVYAATERWLWSISNKRALRFVHLLLHRILLRQNWVILFLNNSRLDKSSVRVSTTTILSATQLVQRGAIWVVLIPQCNSRVYRKIFYLICRLENKFSFVADYIQSLASAKCVY